MWFSLSYESLTCDLKQTISQCTLAMIYVCDDAKVTDFLRGVLTQVQFWSCLGGKRSVLTYHRSVHFSVWPEEWKIHQDHRDFIQCRGATYWENQSIRCMLIIIDADFDLNLYELIFTIFVPRIETSNSDEYWLVFIIFNPVLKWYVSFYFIAFHISI